jgi:hypothetical protein
MAKDIMKAAEELGYRSNVDLNGEDSIGYTIAQANNRDGARLSSNKAFISPILNRPNLFVSMESMVSEKKWSLTHQCDDYLKHLCGIYLKFEEQWKYENFHRTSSCFDTQ